jgi:hypothetical protein
MPQEFTHFADRVRTMLGEGDSLATIGGEVDCWPLPAEQRSALWLFAWSSGAAGSAGLTHERSAERRVRSAHRRVDYRGSR